MSQAGQPQTAIFKVRQDGENLGRDVFFRCGFRPSMIFCFPNNEQADFMYVDGINVSTQVMRRATNLLAKDGGYDDDSTPPGPPGPPAPPPNPGSAGIRLTDDGFWIGKLSMFDVDTGSFTFLVFGAGYDKGLVILDSSLPVYNPDGGNADQFDVTLNDDGSGKASEEYSDYGVFQGSS